MSIFSPATRVRVCKCEPIAEGTTTGGTIRCPLFPIPRDVAPVPKGFSWSSTQWTRRERPGRKTGDNAEDHYYCHYSRHPRVIEQIGDKQGKSGTFKKGSTYNPPTEKYQTQFACIIVFLPWPAGQRLGAPGGSWLPSALDNLLPGIGGDPGK